MRGSVAEVGNAKKFTTGDLATSFSQKKWMLQVPVRFPHCFCHTCLNEKSEEVEIAVKCTRCSVRQRQEDFPRAHNLKYLKTCNDCTLKLADARQKKRDQHSESSSQTSPEGAESRRKGPVPQDMTEKSRLGWPEFQQLLQEHKDNAFELDAEVKLGDFPDGRPVADSSDVAKSIAREVWKATDYRFM